MLLLSLCHSWRYTGFVTHWNWIMWGRRLVILGVTVLCCSFLVLVAIPMEAAGKPLLPWEEVCCGSARSPQDFSLEKDLWSEWTGSANLVCKHFPDQIHLGNGNQSTPVLLGQKTKQSKNSFSQKFGWYCHGFDRNGNTKGFKASDYGSKKSADYGQQRQFNLIR